MEFFGERLLKMVFIRERILRFVIYAPRLDLKFTLIWTHGPRIMDHMVGRDDLEIIWLKNNEH